MATAKQVQSAIANMVAAATAAPAATTEGASPAKAEVATPTKPTKAQKAKASATAKKIALAIVEGKASNIKQAVEVVSKTQAKKAAKPTPAAKKAAKAGAKVAIAKAQKTAAAWGANNPNVVKSDKQGLTYGQWLKLLQNTAAQREVKIPATQAALDKKFQPLYMKGAKIGEALEA